jgi:hypothetical protein
MKQPGVHAGHRLSVTIPRDNSTGTQMKVVETVTSDTTIGVVFYSTPRRYLSVVAWNIALDDDSP